MKRLWHALKPNLGQMLAAVLLSAASLGAAIGLLATSAWLISMASTRPPILVLEVAIVSVRFFGLSRGVMKYASRILEHNAALKIQSSLRVSILKSFTKLLPNQYASLHRGNFLSQIITDVELSQDLWLRVLSPWLAALLSGCAGISIIYWLLPAFGKVLAVIFLTTTFLIPLVAWISGKTSNARKYETQLFDQIMQIAESAPESLIYGYDKELIAQIENQQSEIAAIEAHNAAKSGYSSALYFVALGTSIVLAARFAAAAALSHQLAGINIAVIILTPLAIFEGLGSVPAAFSQLKQIIGSIDAISHYLPTDTNVVADQEPDVTLASSPEIRAVSELEFKDVHPQLPGAKTATLTAVVKPGEVLILEGRSGSGKSSIINALLGFIPYEGEILINGAEICDQDRLLFSTLLQDDYLFQTSIRENLKIGNPLATDLELLEVLELVELGALIQSLPEGLDTLIGSLGFNFSGGEKQRIRLARVLLRDRPVVILDEPFEYLDSNQVERLAGAIARRLQDKVLIVVSHLTLDIPRSHRFVLG